MRRPLLKLDSSRRPAIARESRDPLAGAEPISFWLIGLYVAALFVAGIYFGRYSGDFTGDSLDPVPVAAIENSPPRAKTELSPPVSQEAGVTRILIQNMRFNPATVEVKKGAIVEWTNADITPHTATSASFDSGSIDPDQSSRHSFNETGTFPYACRFHPEMHGTVTVKD